jgi:hypothetical protein
MDVRTIVLRPKTSESLVKKTAVPIGYGQKTPDLVQRGGHTDVGQRVGQGHPDSAGIVSKLVCNSKDGCRYN